MRKIFVLLAAINLSLGYSLQARAQSAELTASGGAFEGYSSSSSNTSLSTYGAREMTREGAVFGQNSQTDIAASELAHRLQQDVQDGTLTAEEADRILTHVQQSSRQFDRNAIDYYIDITERDMAIEGAGSVAELERAFNMGMGIGQDADILELYANRIGLSQADRDRLRQNPDAFLSRHSQEFYGSDRLSQYRSGIEYLRQVERELEQFTDQVGPELTGIYGDLECRSPCAIPTGLLGNAALNDPAYYLDTWVIPPWITPYINGSAHAAAGLSQFDARSWISQMPNGSGYSTTTGFPHPYSGLYGPLVSDSYSNADITFDPLGRAGLPTAGAPVVASLFDGLRGNPIAEAVANGANLSFARTAALVQAGILPLHFLITWGENSSDLDLHLTGPLGNSRFHIYFGADGSLSGQPNAMLIDDCVSASCGEVIRVEGLNPGGVYRASVYNYDDPSFSSTNLSTSSNVQLQVIRGGTVQVISGPDDNGSTVTGGEVLFSGSPTAGQAGNTWVAVEVNPNTGDISFVNDITNSANSGSVQ